MTMPRVEGNAVATMTTLCRNSKRTNNYSTLMIHLRCYCTFSNSCPNLQQQPQGHLVSPKMRPHDVNKRRTTIYKGARRPATTDVPKLSTTEHFHDTQPLILFVTCILFICNKDIFRY